MSEATHTTLIAQYATSAYESYSLSPQQKRHCGTTYADSTVEEPSISFWLRGLVDEELIVKACQSVLASVPALRTRVFDNTAKVFQPSIVTGSAEESLGAPISRICVRREGDAPDFYVQICAPRASVDFVGLHRIVELVVAHCSSDNSRQVPDMEPAECAEYSTALLAAAETAVNTFWPAIVASLPLKGGRAVLDHGTVHKFDRVELPAIEIEGFRGQNAELRRLALRLWISVVNESLPEDVCGEVYVYSMGLASEHASIVGCLGRYVPIRGDTGVGYTQATDSAWDRMLDLDQLDAMSEFYDPELFPPNRLSIGFRFAEVAGGEVFPGTRIESIRSLASTREFGLELEVLTNGSHLMIALEFDESIHERRVIQNLGSVFACKLLSAIDCHHAEQTEASAIFGSMDYLSLMDGELKENGGSSPLDFYTLFEEQAKKTPDVVAVMDGTTRYTYHELLVEIEQFDNTLGSFGVQRGQMVGICLRRTSNQLIAMMGTLRRNAYYLPLAAENPASRNQAIVSQAMPNAIVCETETRAIFGDFSGCLINIQDGRHRLHHPIADVQREASGAADIAYVLYTSGSTGAPKGVRIGRSALTNYLVWAINYYRVDRGSGAVVFTSTAFDMTVTSLFAPLLVGRCVYLMPDNNIEGLAQFLRICPKLSFLKMTPSALQILGQILQPEELDRATHQLIIGGEQLHRYHFSWLSDRTSLLITNEYGPTEATVGCIVNTFCADEDTSDRVPIGKPIWNFSICVADRRGRPTLRGVPGEILISGSGLSSGYHNNLAETEKRFASSDLFGGQRFYRTGDLAVLDEHDNLVYIGRTDDQVKIHGYRVELGEIEATIGVCPNVRIAAVVVASSSTEPQSIVAFVELRNYGGENEIEQLVTWIQTNLPFYMQPHRIVPVDHIPLNENGKIDRSALKRFVGRQDPQPRQSPVAETEARNALREVWENLLGVSICDESENFFAAGGDSIKALHLASRMKEKGFKVSIAQILNARSFGRIADELMRSRPNAATHANEGPLRLSSAQKAFLRRSDVERSSWALYWIVPFEHQLDLQRLARAATMLKGKHPALRSTFSPQDYASTVVGVEAMEAAEVRQIAVPSSFDDDFLIKDFFESQIALNARRLNLASGPLAMVLVLDAGTGRGTFVTWLVHHLVADVVSLQLLTQELLDGYINDTTTLSGCSPDGYMSVLSSGALQKDFSFPLDRTPQLEMLGRFTHKYILSTEDSRNTHPVNYNRMIAQCIVSATARALAKRNSSLCSPFICYEHHGRSGGTLHDDLSSEVGWFSQYHSVALDSAVEHISWIETSGSKSDELLTSGESVVQMLPDFCINFLGSVTTASQDFLPDAFSSLRSGTRHLLFPVELVCWRTESHVELEWVFDRSTWTPQCIEELCHDTLVHLTEELLDPVRRRSFASAFSTQNLSEADLTEIYAEFESEST